MKLGDLIEKYALVTQEEVAAGLYARKVERFTPESRKIMENKIIAWFEGKGWTSKRKRGHKWVSRNKHVKIDWVLEDGWNLIGRAELSAKTPNGGWAKHHVRQKHWRNQDLQILIDAAKLIKAPVPITKTSLPKPFKIGGCLSHQYGKGVYYTIGSNNKWKSINVLKIVGLDENGVVSEEEVARPGEKPWFLCSIITWDSYEYCIITDGEILHPVKSRIKVLKKAARRGPGRQKIYRVFADPRGRKNKWLEDTTSADLDLLNEAIKIWFAEQKGDNASEKD